MDISKLSPLDRNHFLFAAMFRMFMLKNNKHLFSAKELEAVAQQINRLCNNQPKRYNLITILTILSKFGIKDVYQKHSGSERHHLWFVKPLCPTTLKLPNGV